MSWSDDTRCLYCEGRLPLYRKITHGQFCSSQHRKAYWQEHERLAVERLHQTQSTLRSYNPLVPQNIQPEPLPFVEGQPSTLANLALRELERDLELDPIPDLYSIPEPDPQLDEEPEPAFALLSLLTPEFQAAGRSFPELVAADPFEYEITRPPMQPSHAIRLGVKPFPQGPPVAIRSLLGPQASSATKATAGIHIDDIATEACLPKSKNFVSAICPAGQVGMPVGLRAQLPATPIATRLQALEMEPVRVTSVPLEVPLQSDVLLQLLDQQIPRPDSLYGLAHFAAHQSVSTPVRPALNQFDVRMDASFPVARVTTPEYQLVSSTNMLELSSDMAPAQVKIVSRTPISQIEGTAQKITYAAARPVAKPLQQIGMAGLQKLGANLLAPSYGVPAVLPANFLVFDFSTGVSSDVTYPTLPATVAPIVAQVVPPQLNALLPLTFAKTRKVGRDVPRVEAIARLLPQPLETHPVYPSSRLEPLDGKSPQDVMRDPQSATDSFMQGRGLKKMVPAWAHATGFWQHAPRDLKILLFAIPVLLALVFHPGWPTVAVAAPQPSSSFTGNFKRVLNTEWVNVRQTLENRAAVALDEDFRAGLDNWTSQNGSTTEWSFDPTGFVRPGPLALYRPSVNLTDYQVQFLGLIDKKALSWVVRAADFDNFYVIKLAIVKPGPTPTIGLTRYAVIGGKSQDRHDINIPISARTDTVYNIRMDVHGSEFSVEVQGQMADSWTETRLPRGGIGFFTASGEASRLRWVQITHQYDMLGRLCAYLAPYDTTNGSWQP